MKHTRCLMCDTPRPKAKLAGVCGDCFDLCIALQKFAVRKMASEWERDVAERRRIIAEQSNPLRLSGR